MLPKNEMPYERNCRVRQTFCFQVKSVCNNLLSMELYNTRERQLSELTKVRNLYSMYDNRDNLDDE